MSAALNDDARVQNALMLAKLLGDEAIDRAQELLDAELCIQFNPTSTEQAHFAHILFELLRRTISRVELQENGGECVCVVRRVGAALCWIAIDASQVVISSEPVECIGFHAPDGPTRVVAACYASAFVLARIVERDQLSTPSPLVIPRSTLPALDGNNVTDLGECWILGAGAVGCGFLWALSGLSVSGILHVVDGKKVTRGNLNRQVLYDEPDVGANKAEVAVRRAASFLPLATLLPHVGKFQDVLKGQPMARCIVGLDSREVRQELQMELPAEVFDASTTGATEVLFHYNKLGEGRACLGCIYPPREDRLAHMRHVAAGLGLEVEDVLADFISADVARKIEQSFPAFKASEVEGRAIDSIYREACGASVLKSPRGEQVVAPFSFVSVLAGTLMAMHLVSRLQGHNFTYNLWPVSPWRPPFLMARQEILAQPGCTCATPAYARAVTARLNL